MEILSRDLGFNESTNSIATPGVKIRYEEEKHAPTDPLPDIVNAIPAARKGCCRISFNDLTEIIEHSHTDPAIPRDHLLRGRIGASHEFPFPRGHNRLTGLHPSETPTHMNLTWFWSHTFGDSLQGFA